MSSDLLSRNLDTTPAATDQPNDKTCNYRRVLVSATPGNPHQAVVVGAKEDVCGKPATHVTLKTCCGRFSYQCDEHAPAFVGNNSTTCLHCHHRCLKDVCCHRIVTPL